MSFAKVSISSTQLKKTAGDLLHSVTLNRILPMSQAPTSATCLCTTSALALCVTAPPRAAVSCSCAGCRRRFGLDGTRFLVFARAAVDDNASPALTGAATFRLVDGAPEAHFCVTCGTTVFFAVEGTNDVVVPAAAFPAGAFATAVKSARKVKRKARVPATAPDEPCRILRVAVNAAADAPARKVKRKMRKAKTRAKTPAVRSSESPTRPMSVAERRLSVAGVLHAARLAINDPDLLDMLDDDADQEFARILAGNDGSANVMDDGDSLMNAHDDVTNKLRAVLSTIRDSSSSDESWTDLEVSSSDDDHTDLDLSDSA